SGRVQLDAVVGHPTVDNGVLALFVGRLLNESFARVFTQTVVLARPDPDQLDFVVVNDIISWSPETSKPCSYEAQYPVSIRPRAFREVQTVKEEVTAEPDSYLTRVLKTENSTEKRARPREQPSDNTTRERVLWISTVPEAYVDSQIKRDVEAFGRRTLSKPVYVEELRRFESKHAVYVLLSDASTARRLMKKTFFWSEAASVEARIGRARSNPFERVIEP
ncbi:MAG: uncharacterized protein KVP18_005094, partial [Porospora cf. gigantea A]|uniref:uncharacterized protein n=1 Tax=Porospora cf. gigantea A TaxID=2853593 RepID=UPI00355A3844